MKLLYEPVKVSFFSISRGSFWSICAKRAINGQQLNCHRPEKEIVNENPSRNKSQDNFSCRKMSVHYFNNIVSRFSLSFSFNLLDIITVCIFNEAWTILVLYEHISWMAVYTTFTKVHLLIDNCRTESDSPSIRRIYGDVTGPGRRIKFQRP